MLADFLALARELVTRPGSERKELDAALVGVILELTRCLAVLRGEKQRMHQGKYEHTMVRKVREVL